MVKKVSMRGTGVFTRMGKTLAGDILRGILIAGGVLLVLSSPYGASRLIKAIREESRTRASNRSVRNAFDYLRRKGYLSVESRHGKIHCQLTLEGEGRAREYERLQKLRPLTGSRWDGKWRTVIFDVRTEDRLKRDALRFMLKRLGFQALQKSAWVTPFDCRKEFENLRSFFGLSDTAVRLIVSGDMGEMDTFRRHFRV